MRIFRDRSIEKICKLIRSGSKEDIEVAIQLLLGKNPPRYSGYPKYKIDIRKGATILRKLKRRSGEWHPICHKPYISQEVKDENIKALRELADLDRSAELLENYSIKL